MNISWDINNLDIQKVKDFVDKHDNPFVQKRISRNIQRQNIIIDRNNIIKYLIMCLLTSQQRSGPNTPVGRFLQLDPFPLTFETISESINIKEYIKQTLQQNGLNRMIENISKYFSKNFQTLQNDNWALISIFKTELNGKQTNQKEREIADFLNDIFLGFGPKQSRNFLQGLGLTKYEIPIDSRITNWLNDFGFPVTLTSSPLQDKGYYHFVSDGLQKLCDLSNIYPCVLDAAVFSSYDNGEWNDNNTVF